MGQQHAWVRFTCSTDRSTRIATFRKPGAEWQLVSVSRQPSAPGSATAAGALGMNGPFGISPEYRGCPGCGNDSYTRCAVCGELGCWRSSRPRFSCGVCGNGGKVTGRITSINALDAG
jgi:hypothetical protein